MDKLKLYYIDLNSSLGENFSEYEFNKNNIPLVRFNRSPNWQHNPVTVCQYALKQFNQFKKKGDEEALQIFFNQAKWLLQNHQNGPNDSAVWYYHLNIPFYNLKNQWISGMAQGEALSVLLRAYQLTKEQQYMDLANRVWNIFSVSVENGGVLGTFPDGAPIIEEYPTNPGSCVLNGFIFALFGIYDYMILTGRQDVNKFFLQSIKSLTNNLYRYDTSFWSLYDLYSPVRLTSRSYHRLHVMLLDALSKIIDERTFMEETSSRWKGYLGNPFCNIKWAINKIRQRWLR